MNICKEIVVFVAFSAYFSGMSNRIFLVGLMGAGKTTVGRQLARALGLPFYDSDREIERRTGVDIPLIFDIEGEEGFRKREKSMIDELTSRDDIVLATGGGAILDCDNRKMLSERGIVIYLQASVDQLFKRTCKDQKRPLLQTEDPKAKLEELSSLREPMYLEIANMTVKTDESTIKKIINDIQDKISEINNSPEHE